MYSPSKQYKLLPFVVITILVSKAVKVKMNLRDLPVCAAIAFIHTVDGGRLKINILQINLRVITVLVSATMELVVNLRCLLACSITAFVQQIKKESLSMLSR